MAFETGRFTEGEYEERRRRVRAAMAKEGVDALIITNPENIYYLTGIDHQGYFAFSALLVSLEAKSVIVMRAMERAILKDVAPDFELALYSDGVQPLPKAKDEEVDISLYGAGHQEGGGLHPSSMSVGVSVRAGEGPPSDYAAPAEALAKALERTGNASGRVAFERTSSYLPYAVAASIVDRLPSATWMDGSDIVSDCRMIQSPAELACTRRAASISDAMVMTGTALAGRGVEKRDIMASIYQVMFQRGSTYPAFVPLVRSTRTLTHEHGTWDDTRLRAKDVLFLEMSGCYARYHAPLGRLVHIGSAPSRSRRIAGVCLDALTAAKEALKPGIVADEVYGAWQAVVDRAGLSHYKRHHCGYMIGIGFPPSWSGGGVPRGLRAGSNLEIQTGMVFHLMSWLLRTGKGDAFLSDTVVVTESGAEFVTRAPRDVIVR